MATIRSSHPRLVVGFLVVGALVGGLTGSQAAAPRLAVSEAAPVDRAHRYYLVGPGADYDGDSGGIGQVEPLAFEVPGEGPHVGVVEVSFEYRTEGAGPFVVTLGLEDGDGHDVTVRPERLSLAKASHRGSTTVRFLAPGLDGGATYKAYVGVNSVFSGGPPNVIRTRKVLVTVELSTG